MMNMLKCDICGGNLVMQEGGENAICSSCGMVYSLGRVREMYAGMKVSVTGSDEDISQWKTLTETYIKNCDFPAAEQVVRKILEADPNDEFANDIYKKCQTWKNLKINERVLVKYEGVAEHLDIPDGIEKIGRQVLYGAPSVVSVTVPAGVKIIGDGAFVHNEHLQKISLSEGLEQIGTESAAENIAFAGSVGVFEGCKALESIKIPSTVTYIAERAFFDCTNLKCIELPDGLKAIGDNALKTGASPRTKIVYNGSLSLERALNFNTWKEKCEREEAQKREEEQRAKWRNQTRCQYCGGSFKGLFSQKCSSCNRTKDY